jgi:hypothetical protein
MWVLLIAAFLVVAVAAVVVVLRRPKSSDLSSVRRYHSALGTIEHLADRPGPTAGRVVNPPRGAGSGGGGPGRSVPPVPVRGSDEFPDPENPIVFDDARPRDRPGGGHPPAGVPLHRPDRAQRHVLESMNHRPRRATTVMVVVIVVAVVGVLALLGSRHPKAADRGHPSASTSVSATSSTTSGASGSGGHRKGRGHKARTTPTTLPSKIVALSSTPASAVYPVASDSYRVTVKASGPCWVQATSTSTGSTLWTGTMQAGASQVIPATGTITVELGSATGALSLDGVPVVLPTPSNTPFVATFQPSGPSTSPSTTAPGSVTTSTVG